MAGRDDPERRRLGALNSSLSEAMRTISECDAIMERLHRARAERSSARPSAPPAPSPPPPARRARTDDDDDYPPVRTSDSNREIIRKLVLLGKKKKQKNKQRFREEEESRCLAAMIFSVRWGTQP